MSRPVSSRAGKADVSVFEKADSLADVTFAVEGRDLYFTKVFLRAVSPVFDRMFNSEFKEKGLSRIPLPEKKLKDVDIFLQNIHPVHAWKPLEDDTLGVLLRLAGEYQTEHIRQKCVHYLHKQIKDLEQKCRQGVYSEEDSKAMANKLIFYLCLCEQYELSEPREKLIRLAARLSMKMLESDDFFRRLSEASKNAILRARCDALEQKVSAPYGFLR